MEGLNRAGVKCLNVHPENPKEHGLPAVMGIIELVDPETGFPIALMDGTWITNMRTGATAAVATRHLTRADCV
jgi:alanine dehydrogenase